MVAFILEVHQNKHTLKVKILKGELSLNKSLTYLNQSVNLHVRSIYLPDGRETLIAVEGQTVEVHPKEFIDFGQKLKHDLLISKKIIHK